MLNVKGQLQYTETHKNLSAEYMCNYRKGKAQENKTPHASTSNDPTPTPTYKIIIKLMNMFQRILLVIHLVMPAAYVIEYGTRMI
jgi:hypothetical protein